MEKEFCVSIPKSQGKLDNLCYGWQKKFIFFLLSLITLEFTHDNFGKIITDGFCKKKNLAIYLIVQYSLTDTKFEWDLTVWHGCLFYSNID